MLKEESGKTEQAIALWSEATSFYEKAHVQKQSRKARAGSRAYARSRSIVDGDAAYFAAANYILGRK